MDSPTFNTQEELFNLVAYLITSARGLYDEPPDYGSFRLLDASGRLLEIMSTTGDLDPFLARLKEEIDAEREGSMDNDRQRQNLERWVIEIAQELRHRTGTD
ncbi:MAG TPA: DUF6092 family protein [Anaerolineales bacterium]|nr:DUF6092 family protein [Anaerolineales bacterium]